VYNFQDVSKWKDLGPKFVLTVLRDFEASQKKSASFVRDVFLTVAQVMSDDEGRGYERLRVRG
jgi:uncharacterized protein (DUF608 family)